MTGNSVQAQPISGDNLTLNTTTPFVSMRDPGGPATEFYQISPDSTYLNFHTNATRTDTDALPPFRIPWNAQHGLMTVGVFGVEIGAADAAGVADAALHVHSFGPGVDNSLPSAKILVENEDPASAPRTLFEAKNRGGSRFAFTNIDTGRSWAFQNNASDGFLINLLGSGGNEMSIRKTGMVTMGPGGVQNFILDPSGNLTILGTLNSSSDRNLKEGFEDVNPRDILARICTLPITTWKYKRDQQPTRHIGPVAQDFHAAFRMGNSEKNISVTDASGVALAGIQALSSRCDDLQQRVENRDNRIADLEAQLADLATRMTQMESSLPR